MSLTTASEEFFSSEVTLKRIQRGKVRALKGFRKSHQVPAEYNDWAAAFAAKIAADDLTEDIEQRFTDFRRQLGWRRVDLQVSDPDGGVAAIRTPAFEYRVQVELAEDDPSEVEWTWMLHEFTNFGLLSESGMDRIFSGTFDTVEFFPGEPLQLEGFIDRIEEQGPTGIILDYDHHATWCRLQIKGLGGELLLTSDSIAMTLHRTTTPGALISAFMTTHQRFF